MASTGTKRTRAARKAQELTSAEEPAVSVGKGRGGCGRGQDQGGPAAPDQGTSGDGEIEGNEQESVGRGRGRGGARGRAVNVRGRGKQKANPPVPDAKLVGNSAPSPTPEPASILGTSTSSMPGQPPKKKVNTNDFVSPFDPPSSGTDQAPIKENGSEPPPPVNANTLPSPPTDPPANRLSSSSSIPTHPLPNTNCHIDSNRAPQPPPFPDFVSSCPAPVPVAVSNALPPTHHDPFHPFAMPAPPLLPDHARAPVSSLLQAIPGYRPTKNSVDAALETRDRLDKVERELKLAMGSLSKLQALATRVEERGKGKDRSFGDAEFQPQCCG